MTSIESDPLAPPSVEYELNRKTLEHLAVLVHRQETGRVPLRELSRIANSLWHVTAGLVPESTTEIICKLASITKQPTMKRHFVGKGFVHTVAWYPDGKGFVLRTRDAKTGLPTAPILDGAEVDERNVKILSLCAAFLKAGYLEI